MTEPAKSQVSPLGRDQFVEEAMARYESRLIGFAVGIVGNAESARDVVQDTFVRLHKQDPDAVRDSLKAWLFRVCRNRALDVLKKERRSIPSPQEAFSTLESRTLPPDRQSEMAEEHRRVLGFIDRLSDNQQEVIRLKFQSELSYREISELTGLSEGNVGFLLHTGLKRLRGWLTEDTGPPTD